MKVYFYVERCKLESVRTLGYLSVRAQSELLGTVPVEKYAAQFNAAYLEHSELRSLLSSFKTDSNAKKTLAYLDWRDEATNRGSRAIYFLFHPIPDDPDVRGFIREFRDDFLRDRVLLEYELRVSFTCIGTVDWQHVHQNKWWIDRWLTQPRGPDLWFANIPHGYFIGYAIPFNELKVVT